MFIYERKNGSAKAQADEHAGSSPAHPIIEHPDIKEVGSMIKKEERRKRLIEDFKKVAEHTGKDVSEAVAFAQNISDETLDYLEELGYSSEREVTIKNRVDTNLEIKSDDIGLKTTPMIFDLKLTPMVQAEGTVGSNPANPFPLCKCGHTIGIVMNKWQHIYKITDKADKQKEFIGDPVDERFGFDVYKVRDRCFRCDCTTPEPTGD
jgi:hypothetical protein